jgi:peptide subunit release factor 1 (eRF1)
VHDVGVVEAFTAAASTSPTGSVFFAIPTGIMLIIPPFAVEIAAEHARIEPAPLIELLERDRVIALLLLRLGGFSVGLVRDGRVVDSKTDQRFVKNRHRKGGSSQRRFERIREKQIHELFGAACRAARAKLEPHAAEIEHFVLGGDRHTLLAFRKQCGWLERFGERIMPRVLPVRGDPRRDSLDAALDAIWSSDVYIADAAEAPG